MTPRAELEKRIQKRREEISALKVKVREAEVYISALEEALRVLPREGINNGNAGDVLRQGSNAALAREAILLAGRPMHLVELLKARLFRVFSGCPADPCAVMQFLWDRYRPLRSLA